MPLLSDADAGVNAMSPATSRNASELPAVAAGTLSVTLDFGVALRLDRHLVLLSDIVCGEPCGSVARDVERRIAWCRRFCSVIVPAPSLKSLLNSSNPKLMRDGLVVGRGGDLRAAPRWRVDEARSRRVRVR